MRFPIKHLSEKSFLGWTPELERLENLIGAFETDAREVELQKRYYGVTSISSAVEWLTSKQENKRWHGKTEKLEHVLLRTFGRNGVPETAVLVAAETINVERAYRKKRIPTARNVSKFAEQLTLQLQTAKTLETTLKDFLSYAHPDPKKNRDLILDLVKDNSDWKRFNKHYEESLVSALRLQEHAKLRRRFIKSMRKYPVEWERQQIFTENDAVKFTTTYYHRGVLKLLQEFASLSNKKLTKNAIYELGARLMTMAYAPESEEERFHKIFHRLEKAKHLDPH